MSSEQNNNTEESNFMFFLRLVASNWKLLLYTYLAVGIVTVIILLVIPKWYKSEATVVILNEKSSSLTNVLSEFSSLGGLAGGLGGGGNTERYIEYIHTKKIYDRLIEEFDLMEAYGVRFKEDAYQRIFNSLSAVDNENQTFNISYIYEEDPKKAAEIVQFLFEELDEIALEVDKAQASNYRSYIENYYMQTKNELLALEDSLTRFQSKTGILDLNSQLQFTIKALAELEKQKITQEIEKKYIQEAYQNPSRISDINSRLEAINQNIDSLEQQHGTILLSIDDIPEKGADFLRLKRDILVNEKVSEFLRLQYEQALLDEQKVSSNLYLVDPPHVPEKKVKPQRTQILFIVMFFTVFVSLIFIRVKWYAEENRDKLMEAVTNP